MPGTLNDCWVYVAWVRNLQLPADDQDGEYPATILIVAQSSAEAKEWGDRVYADALARDDQYRFQWSEVHRPDDERYRREVARQGLERYWHECQKIALGDYPANGETIY